MHPLVDTILALLASYGIVFLIWWIVALIRVRNLSSCFSVQIHSQKDLAYLNWLKYAGIFPLMLQEKEDFNGTGTNDN